MVGVDVQAHKRPGTNPFGNVTRSCHIPTLHASWFSVNGFWALVVSKHELSENPCACGGAWYDGGSTMSANGQRRERRHPLSYPSRLYLFQRLNEFESQADFARQAEVDSAALSRILTGQTGPTVATLERLAAILKVGVETILHPPFQPSQPSP